MKDYYKILEVHPEASKEVIKRAYQTLALRYHPDKHIPARKKWADDKFKMLSEAYQVVSDPVKRREYDRNGYSEQLSNQASTISARAEEEAYFYYRMGLGHYKNAQNKASWRILLGLVETDLKKARDDFITVLDDYPDSKYVEDAHFYYICTLMEGYEYTQGVLKEIEEEFAEFLDEFPRSKWTAQVKMRFAKFYLFKKTDYSKVNELLTDIIHLDPGTGLFREVEVLLEYTQELNKNE